MSAPYVDVEVRRVRLTTRCCVSPLCVPVAQREAMIADKLEKLQQATDAELADINNDEYTSAADKAEFAAVTNESTAAKRSKLLAMLHSFEASRDTKLAELEGDQVSEGDVNIRARMCVRFDSPREVAAHHVLH
jgi:hypothetical protein